MRVSPELIKASTGVQVWAQTFDAPFSDVFTLQSDIASKVASALDVKLLKPEAASLEQKLTTNAEAYDYYLRGVAYLERSDLQADHESGIRLLERGTQLDPQFAAAYAKISYAHSNMYWFFYDRSEGRIEQCRKMVEKALALNPDLSAAHEAMAWYYDHAKLDYANALKEFSVALTLQPNNTDVYYGMAAVFRREGHMSESIDAFRKAVAGNPRAADLVRQLGETLMLAREYEKKLTDGLPGQSIWLRTSKKSTLERAENLILWKGDVLTAQRIIDEGLSISTLRQNESLSPIDFTVAAMRGDFSAAEGAIGRIRGTGIDNQFVFCPSILFLAQLEDFRGARAKAKVCYDSARAILERRLRAMPDDERIHSAAGNRLCRTRKSS